VIIGTAGHVDHGKTALVRALTGVDTDRLAEEKRRGITIELGFAPFHVPGAGTAGVVDVPGHEAFVRTMVAGATGIDVALLVVAANEGVMPQTREHVAILDLLGVKRAIVAISKADLADPAEIAAAARQAHDLLSATKLDGAPTFVVSSVTGEGIEDLREALRSVARVVAERDPDDLVRLPVDRVFTKPGAGTVVTGTLWSGALRVGGEVTVFPAGQRARVRGVQTHGAVVDVLSPGSRAAASLAGIDHDSVGRGSVVVAGPGWSTTRVVRADVALLDDAGLLTPRTRVRFHLGTQDVGARIVCAGGALRAGELRAARIVLEAPILSRGGDRFVLRRTSPAGTLGGGVVTDSAPGRRRARPFARPGLATHERLERIVDEAGLAGIPRDAIPVRTGLAPSRADALIDASRAFVRIGDDVVSAHAVDTTLNSTLRWIDEFHRAHPTESGAPLEAARAECHASPRVAQYIIEALAARRLVSVEGTMVRRANWQPGSDGGAAARLMALHARLLAAGVAVPSVRDLEREFGGHVVQLLRQLERDGRVAALSAERFAAAAVVGALRSRVLSSVSPARSYTPSELKVVFGVSRQYLMPWLEYFDRMGFSRREGDGRRFLPEPSPGGQERATAV